MKGTLLKRCAAEFIGTFALVFFGCASIATAGSGGAYSFIITGLTFAFTILAMIYALGPISGGHFNPAVTFGLSIAKLFPKNELIFYVIAQFFGSIVATACLGEILTNKFVAVHYGANFFNPNIPLGIGFVVEVAITAALVMVISGVITNPKVSTAVPGLATGFTILMCAFSFGPITGASMNPARSLGPAVFEGGEALSNLWIYISAQLVGGAVGAMLYEIVRIPNGKKEGI